MRKLFFILIMIVFCGCEKQDNVTRGYEEFSINETLVSIDDFQYTKEMCEEDARLITALKKTKKKKSQDIVVTDRERSVACSNFISRCTVEKALTSIGVSSRNDVDPKRVKALARRLNLKKSNISEEALKRRFERDALIASYVNLIVSNDYPVTSNQIINAQNRIKWSNEISEATNALVYATASNVYARIKKGEDFFQLAKEFDQLPVHGDPGEWGRITASWYSDDAAFLKLLKETPIGGITPPVEADEGLLIVKVLSKKSLEKDGNKEDYYDLQRIYFKLPIFYKEESYEDTKKNIHKAKCEKLAREIIDKAIKDVKVVYPNGKIKWMNHRKEKTNEGK